MRVTYLAAMLAGAGLMSTSAQAASIIAVGTTKGPAVVKVINKAATTQALAVFMPYGFAPHGVAVAVGDVNRDGSDDVITGPSAGAAIVKVFSQNGTLLKAFDAYPGFTGGVNVAAGDVNNDGWADIITAAAGGAGPHVKVFSGADLSLLRSFFAYSPAFVGGVHVAAGDVDGDGYADIITGTGMGATHVKVFDGQTNQESASFFAYEGAFLGGVRVGSTDYDGDGLADIITGTGPGAGPHVKVFDGETVGLLGSFFAFDSQYTGGIYVAGGPVMATPGNPSSAAILRIFSDGQAQSVTPFPGYVSGLTVAASKGGMPRTPRPRGPFGGR